MNVVEWWNNLYPLTKEELKILEKGLCHEQNLILDKIKKTGKSADVLFFENTPRMAPSQEDFDKLTDEYFSRMPGCKCTHLNKDLSFNVSGTSFINMLFDKYVDDDTLVITSDSEHPSTQARVAESKNKLILSHYNIIRKYDIDYIMNEAKKFKKAFVYIIGTRNDTGEVTPQQFFEDLKKAFEQNGITYKIVLDDVQGMFVVPRDYTLYDFVLGTAHAMIDNYDMGMLISNEYIGGYKAYNWGKEYLDRIDIILKRKDKMNIFKQVMEHYYDKDIKDNPKRHFSEVMTSPAIFYMKLEDDFEVSKEISLFLESLNLLLPDSQLSKRKFIRLRSHWFYLEESFIPKILKVMDYILNTKNKKLDFDIIKELVC